NQPRLSHQARAKRARLHALTGTADIQIDLVVASLGAMLSRVRESLRIAATQLQGHRMLGWIESQQACTIAVQERGGRDHLRVQQRVRGELAQEESAMPIGPVHHRSDAQPAIQLMHSATICDCTVRDVPYTGRTFAFSRKRFAASYCRLSAASRA